MNHSILDIIMNFLAIIVITEFDDYFFYIVQDELLAGLISDKQMLYIPEGKGKNDEVTIELAEILKIEATTSDDARMKL